MKKKHLSGMRIFSVLFTVLLVFPGLAGGASASAGEVKPGDVLCFGEPDAESGFDGKWLVLDAEHTNTGTEGMFLVSLNLVGDENGEPLLFRDIGEVSVSFLDRGEAYASAHPGVTDYQGSDIQRWCEKFSEERFSDAERSALIPASRSDSAIVIPGFGISLPGAPDGTVDFDAADGVLSEDRIFILSVEEVTNSSYGFEDNRSRVALYKGEASGYWLRSPHIPTFPLDVGFVFSFGAVMDYPVNANSIFKVDTYARPACNLDSSRIAALEMLSGADGVTVWRVSFEDGEPNERSYDLAMPVVGAVMDLSAILTGAVIAFIIILAVILALIVWLIARKVKKKKVRCC